MIDDILRFGKDNPVMFYITLGVIVAIITFIVLFLYRTTNRILKFLKDKDVKLGNIEIKEHDHVESDDYVGQNRREEDFEGLYKITRVCQLKDQESEERKILRRKQFDIAKVSLDELNAVVMSRYEVALIKYCQEKQIQIDFIHINDVSDIKNTRPYLFYSKIINDITTENLMAAIQNINENGIEGMICDEWKEYKLGKAKYYQQISKDKFMKRYDTNICILPVHYQVKECFMKTETQIRIILDQMHDYLKTEAIRTYEHINKMEEKITLLAKGG